MQAEITERLERVDDLLQEVSRIKTVVTDAVEDGFKSALKTVKQGERPPKTRLTTPGTR